MTSVNNDTPPSPSTFLALPPEIIADICLACLPPYPICPAPKESAIVLGRICSRLRQVAWSTPALWRALSIRPRPLQEDATDTSLEQDILREFLARSGSCSLSIKLLVAVGGTTEQNVGLMETILLYSSRWEYLVLGIRVGIDAHGVLKGPMPLLRGLEVLGWCNQDLEIPRLPAFDQAPALQSLMLWDVEIRPRVPSTVIPWAQLTALSLAGFQAITCEDILPQTPNLRFLCLAFDHVGEIPLRSSSPQEKIHLSVLETLVLESGSTKPQLSMGVWDLFLVPALRRLQVDGRFLGEDPVGLIEAFQRESGCAIAELRVQGGRTFQSPLQVNVKVVKVWMTEKFRVSEWVEECMPFGLRLGL
ncbi:hypothetical protein HMN09_00797000 [Mycena chlorophos]|uniref:F-box domain-containing protein n=1 Tax=Mycena chlorophos TaxID=658473 RepID=A0A8H6W4J3_MYCCL|nr:hypothetical protein HMN09_00797000 [Mycena chlorophos]